MPRKKSKKGRRQIKPEFRNLATVKQGEAGEAIAMQYFASRGNIPYPVGVYGSHPVDFMVHNPTSGNFIAVEVKTYPRLFASAETGIDAADYRSYIKLTNRNKLKLWLLFIDVFEGGMYGAYLSDLQLSARLKGGKVYFPLARFAPMHELTPEEIATLQPIAKPGKYRYIKPFFGFK